MCCSIETFRIFLRKNLFRALNRFIVTNKTQIREMILKRKGSETFVPTTFHRTTFFQSSLVVTTFALRLLWGQCYKTFSGRNSFILTTFHQTTLCSNYSCYNFSCFDFICYIIVTAPRHSA